MTFPPAALELSGEEPCASGASPELGRGLCIKNTFIDVGGEAAAAARPRARTEPACCLRWVDDEDDEEMGAPSDPLLPLEVHTSSDESVAASASAEKPADDAKSDDDDADDDDGSLHRERCGAGKALRFNECVVYAIQVKNTFVDLEDDDSTPLVRGPRHKTEPCCALRCEQLLDDDDETEPDTLHDSSEHEAAEEEELLGKLCSSEEDEEERWPALQPLLLCGAGGPEASQVAPPEVLEPRVAVAVAWAEPFWPGDARLSTAATAVEAEPPQPSGARSSATQADRKGEQRPPEPAATRVERRAWGRRHVPRAQLQGLEIGEVRGFTRVKWTVDARKLLGSDKQLVSPSFEVSAPADDVPGGLVTFKAMICPLATRFKGGPSFRKSEGKGQVQLKCMSELPGGVGAQVRISIGSGSHEQPLRGPFSHSFASSPVLTLPRPQAEWDFWLAVDENTGAFAVSVDISLALQD